MPKGKLTKRTRPQFNPLAGWGDDTTAEQIGSGQKLILEGDSDCILQFESMTDITDLLPEEDRKEGKPAIYLKFFDGIQLVSIPMGASARTVKFEEHVWYYIHVRLIDLHKAGHNDMKDLNIRRLGKTGEEKKCPISITC